jgi:hypothetical protein
MDTAELARQAAERIVGSYDGWESPSPGFQRATAIIADVFGPEIDRLTAEIESLKSDILGITTYAGKQNNALQARVAELEKERAEEAEADVRGLRRLLKDIAAPYDCGCKPCTGQCRSREALEITIDAFRDEAVEALARTAHYEEQTDDRE